MNKNIITIHPYSRVLKDKKNPKTYPYWDKVVEGIKSDENTIIQLGLKGDKLINADHIMFDLPYQAISSLLNISNVWLSVDSFLPHLANYYKCKPGIVIFSKSDPLIYGYEQNINLLKSKESLRPDQFRIWEQCEYDIDAFIDPEIIINNIRNILLEERDLHLYHVQHP